MADLTEVKVIDRAETNLFRLHSTIKQEAGPWGQFLDNLVNARNVSRQLREEGGLVWEHGSKLSRFGRDMRFARWLTVSRGDDIFVAMMSPHEYTDGPDLKPYLDYRFVVATNNEDLLTTVILYQETILSPAPYEDAPWITPST